MLIYFTSDIHGSDRCWAKFLATPKFYGADVIIVGGDITGKFVVPIVAQSDGSWLSTFNGTPHRLKTADDVTAFSKRVADTGSYPFTTTENEYVAHSGDSTQVDALFKTLVLDRLTAWVRLADERLDGTHIKCIVSGGNDDFWEVDDVLSASRAIVIPEDRIVQLDGGYELFGLGYANITPWDCPRDIGEADLALKIEALARQVQRMERAIFDIHVPPHGTSLDTAPELDSDFNLVVSASGEVKTVPVGSTAVREAILKYQPMLGLHGHVHESGGVRRLGNTTIVNPGSEYQEGVLRGALIKLDPKKGVVSAQLVAG